MSESTKYLRELIDLKPDNVYDLFERIMKLYTMHDFSEWGNKLYFLQKNIEHEILYDILEKTKQESEFYLNSLLKTLELGYCLSPDRSIYHIIERIYKYSDMTSNASLKKLCKLEDQYKASTPFHFTDAFLEFLNYLLDENHKITDFDLQTDLKTKYKVKQEHLEGIGLQVELYFGWVYNIVKDVHEFINLRIEEVHSLSINKNENTRFRTPNRTEQNKTELTQKQTLLLMYYLRDSGLILSTCNNSLLSDCFSQLTGFSKETLRQVMIKKEKDSFEITDKLNDYEELIRALSDMIKNIDTDKTDYHNSNKIE
jgi:hypothetical protein